MTVIPLPFGRPRTRFTLGSFMFDQLLDVVLQVIPDVVLVDMSDDVGEVTSDDVGEVMSDDVGEIMSDDVGEVTSDDVGKSPVPIRAKPLRHDVMLTSHESKKPVTVGPKSQRPISHHGLLTS